MPKFSVNTCEDLSAATVQKGFFCGMAKEDLMKALEGITYETEDDSGFEY